MTDTRIGHGVEMHTASVRFAPLPLETHPIDTVEQSQGWGPFAGYYSPLDFMSARDIVAPGGIDITWLSGDNAATVHQPPNYHVLTIMNDRSVNLVGNTNPGAAIGGNTPLIPYGGSSTIAQGSNQSGSVVSALATIAARLKGGNK